MPEELVHRHIDQFNDTQNRYRQDAHSNLLYREEMKPYLKGRFNIGKPLDEEVSFQVAIGDNERSSDREIVPFEIWDQWREAYNQAVGLQGLEVADVDGERRSQEDTGGAFSDNRVNGR